MGRRSIYPAPHLSRSLQQPWFWSFHDSQIAHHVINISITRPGEDYPEKDKGNISACIELLNQNNITVKTKSKIHQKFAIIDRKIVWYDSINLLSYGKSEEIIMRIDSVDIVNELIGVI